MSHLIIPLTRVQAKLVCDFWREHGGFNYAIVGQPRFKTFVDPHIYCAMFTNDEAARINELLEDIKAKRESEKV